MFTTANFRKFGHCVFLINQNIKNFEIERLDGKTDRSLIINTPTRIFLQADYEESSLINDFNLSEFQIDRILTIIFGEFELIVSIHGFRRKLCREERDRGILVNEKSLYRRGAKLTRIHARN